MEDTAKDKETPRQKAWGSMKSKEWVEGDEEVPLTMAMVSHVLSQILTKKQASAADVKQYVLNLNVVLAAQVEEETAKSLEDVVKTATDRAYDILSFHVDHRIQTTFDSKFEALNDSMEKLQKNIQGVSNSIKNTSQGFPQAQGARNPAPTFASTIQGLPVYHESVVLRNEMKRKQVILDPNPAITDNLKELTPRDLVTKANLALEQIDPCYEDTGDSPRFVACRKLFNGGILLEASDRSVVERIQDPAPRNAFLAALGEGFANIKESSYSLILKFVPVEADLDNPTTLRAIERTHDWEPGAFISARWIKAPERRSEGQRVATMMLRFRDLHAANEALRSGFLYNRQRCFPIKPEPEPTRCFKCNKIGNHFARACNSKEVVCGTCGKEGHESKSCTVMNIQEHWCVNCRTKGHASWSRSCPALTRAKTNHAQRYPESQYRFFPTADQEWTWEQSSGNQTTARRMNEREVSMEEGAAFRPQYVNQRQARQGGPNPPVGQPDNGYQERDILQPGTQRTLEQTQSRPSEKPLSVGSNGMWTHFEDVGAMTSMAEEAEVARNIGQNPSEHQ